jgi:hypothetical protein
MPPPWNVTENKGSYLVADSAGHQIAHVYFKQDWQIELMPTYLTKDEARRIAKAIATKLPGFLIEKP